METQSFETNIINKYILPEYESEIKQFIYNKKNWNRASVVFYTLSTVLMSISSLLTFAAASFESKQLNYIAGSIGLLAIASKEFANFAIKEIQINNEKLNKILKIISIKKINSNFITSVEDSKDIETNDSKIENEDLKIENTTNAEFF